MKVIDKRKLSPDLASKIMAEASVTAGLEHPHIIKVYDHFEVCKRGWNRERNSSKYYAFC